METTWPLRPVASLGAFINGYPFKPDQHGSEGLPVVRIRQLNDPDADVDYFDGHIPPRNHINAGDLIFSWSGSLCVEVWDRGPAYLNQHLFKVEAGPGIDQAWLRWALVYAVELFEPFMHGSAMTHITKPMMRAVRVPVPDLGTQRRIADFLDDQVGRIEAAVALREGHRELLSEKHQAALLRGAFGTSDIRPPSRETWHGTVSLAAGAAVDSTPASWSRRRLKTSLGAVTRRWAQETSRFCRWRPPGICTQGTSTSSRRRRRASRATSLCVRVIWS